MTRRISLSILCLTIVSFNLQAETTPESFLRMLTTATTLSVNACNLIETAGNGMPIQKRDYAPRDVKIALFLITGQLKKIDHNPSSNSSYTNAERNWYIRAQEAITTLQKSLPQDTSESATSTSASNSSSSSSATAVTTSASQSKNASSMTSEFITGAQNGNASLVRVLLALGINVNATTHSGKTALMLAAQNGHTTIVELLIAAGAHVDAETDLRETALMLAVKNGHTTIVELLIAAHANVNAEGCLGETVLMLAAKKGHLTIVEKLIAAGALVNAKDRFGATAIMPAVSNGHVTVVGLLIKHNANVDLMDDFGENAPMIAALMGHSDIVELLLAHGANPKTLYKHNETIYDMVRRDLITLNVKPTHENQTRFSKLSALEHTLIKHHANITGKQVLAERQQQATSAHASSSATQGASFTQPQPFSASTITLPTMNPSASASSSSVTTERHPASQSNNASDDVNDIELMFAAKSGSIDTVKQCIATGANVNAITSDGKTPLMFAAQHGHAAIVEILIEARANVNATKGDEATALMYAAHNGQAKIVTILLKAGACIDATNANKETALMCAAKKGHATIVELLLDYGAHIKMLNDQNETVYDIVRRIQITLDAKPTRENQTLCNNLYAVERTLIQHHANITGKQVLAEKLQQAASSAHASSSASAIISRSSQRSTTHATTQPPISKEEWGRFVFAVTNETGRIFHQYVKSETFDTNVLATSIGSLANLTNQLFGLYPTLGQLNNNEAFNLDAFYYAIVNILLDNLLPYIPHYRADDFTTSTMTILRQLLERKDVISMMAKLLGSKLEATPAHASTSASTKAATITVRSTPTSSASVSSSSTSASNTASATMSLSTHTSTGHATSQPAIPEAWSTFVEMIINQVCIGTSRNYNKTIDEPDMMTAFQMLFDGMRNNLRELYPTLWQFNSLKVFVDTIMNILMNDLSSAIPDKDIDDFRTDAEKALRKLLERDDVIAKLQALLIGFKLKAAAEVEKLNKRHNDDDDSTPGATSSFERKQWQKTVKIKPDSFTNSHATRWGLAALMTLGTNVLHKNIVPGQKVPAHMLAAASA